MGQDIFDVIIVLVLTAFAARGFWTGFVGEVAGLISLVGGFLLASSGLGILGIKDCKTLNQLPALLVPLIWFGLLGLVG